MKNKKFIYHIARLEYTEFYDLDIDRHFILCRGRISVRDEYHARKKNTCENKRFLRETSFHQWAVHVSFSPSPSLANLDKERNNVQRFNVRLFQTIHIFIIRQSRCSSIDQHFSYGI